jgi:DNA uptake protein ComE-like DNA-binding protein
MQKRSLFVLSKPQQGAVLLLLFCLIFIQCFRYFNAISIQRPLALSSTFLFEQKLDSLQHLAQTNSGIRFKFNPNFITDYKAYTIGLSVEEYKRLQHFRSKGKWINSTSAFQAVTQVSDSLLEVLEPQFRFPEWGKKNEAPFSVNSKVKKDLNTADVQMLQSVSGIGSVLSERIVKYRDYLGGFSEMNQCYEVFGLDSLVVQKLREQFEILTPPFIVKLNMNEATLDELQKIPYLSRSDARKIIAYRTKNKTISLNILSELFEDFPNKTERIKLYLY